MHEYLTVVWEGEGTPTADNLAKFCMINKERVLTALKWLKENNPFYADIEIDESFFEAEEYVP